MPFIAFFTALVLLSLACAFLPGIDLLHPQAPAKSEGAQATTDGSPVPAPLSSAVCRSSDKQLCKRFSLARHTMHPPPCHFHTPQV
jgi:hypothetical protein